MPRRLLCALLAAATQACAAPRQVASDAALRQALTAARPGDTILIAPGDYAGGLSAAGLAGEADRPIVIAAADPDRPPRLVGGANALQLSGCSYVELRDLEVSGQTANGLNLDDGGARDFSAHHLTLRRLTVRDTGPDGNRDGIKLSGLRDFQVIDCTVERWGSGGSAIDMVGCHEGLIEGCQFRHEPGQTQNSGVQAKGGSRRVTVRQCRFEHAGSRAVNLGGSTGLEFFRPPLGEGERAEAGELLVEECVFIGSMSPLAFVGVDEAVVRRNTFYRPGRWLIRILQETREPGFVPCRGGVIEDNLFVWRATELATAVNIGGGTAPETFRFRGNAWYCEDRPDGSRPELPAAETDGLYGVDPRFDDAAAGRLVPHGACAGKGAPQG